MLVFDDDKQFYNLVQNGFARYPNKRDLRILCRKWLQEGVPFEQLCDKVVEFCKGFNSQFNYAQNESLILGVVAELKEVSDYTNPFALDTSIVIFKEEIEKIKLLGEKALQKILFTIICLAKWRKTNYIYLNCGSSIKLKDIFDLSGIACTKKEQQVYLHELNTMGAIEVQMKPLLKVFIPCIVEQGEPALDFKIDENLINAWLDVSCPHCERCKSPFERVTNNQKFCKECAKQIKREKDLRRWHEKHNRNPEIT